jgi:predicted membrane protein
VILPAEGRYEAHISQAMGVIEIGVPKGLGVRLNAGTAMVLRQLPGDFQKQSDNVYLSPDYTAADSRVDLDVSLAIGLLTVRYLD